MNPMQLTLTDEQAAQLQIELEWLAWTLASLTAGFPDIESKKLKPLRTRLANIKALARTVKEQINHEA